MQLALAECSKYNKPNYSAIAQKYPPVNCLTLLRRFLKEQVFKTIANSEHRQCLSIEQEEVLISHINKLTCHGLPLTSAIVRNLAEEMISCPIRKN
jgi:hypothetical protein